MAFMEMCVRGNDGVKFTLSKDNEKHTITVVSSNELYGFDITMVYKYPEYIFNKYTEEGHTEYLNNELFAQDGWDVLDSKGNSLPQTKQSLTRKTLSDACLTYVCLLYFANKPENLTDLSKLIDNWDYEHTCPIPESDRHSYILRNLTDKSVDWTYTIKMTVHEGAEFNDKVALHWDKLNKRL